MTTEQRDLVAFHFNIQIRKSANQISKRGGAAASRSIRLSRSEKERGLFCTDHFQGCFASLLRLEIDMKNCSVNRVPMTSIK